MSIFKALSDLKWAQNRPISLLCAPKNGPRLFLESRIFDAFFDPFLVPIQPIFKAFCDFRGAKMAYNGLKMGTFHLFAHPKCSGIIFGETHSKRATTGSKRAKKHLFWHPMWSRIIFEKNLGSVYFCEISAVDVACRWKYPPPPKLQFLKPGSATCDTRSRPPALTFALKLGVIVLHTHRYHPPKLHHNRFVIFAHFACACCCCLLLACESWYAHPRP